MHTSVKKDLWLIWDSSRLLRGWFEIQEAGQPATIHAGRIRRYLEVHRREKSRSGVCYQISSRVPARPYRNDQEGMDFLRPEPN